MKSKNDPRTSSNLKGKPIAQRWGSLKRRDVRTHRDRCLEGEGLEAIRADLQSMVGV